MDQHKSKQTRSYGETCQDTHASRSSAGPSKTTASGGRSTSNDQTRSAPVIPQRQKRNAEVRDTGRILRIADPDSKSPNKSNPSVCTSTDQTSQSVRVKEQSKALQPCRIGRNVSTLSVFAKFATINNLPSIICFLTIPPRNRG